MSYYSETDDISFVPLTVEEERSLFTKFYAGGPDALASRDELIARHLRLTAKLSLTYAKHSLPDDDAISAGNTGLMQALECRKFDPNRGFRFASYLRPYVRGQVFAAMRFRCEGHEATKSDHQCLPEGAAITGAHGCSIDHNPGLRGSGGAKVGPVKKSWEEETAVDHGYESLQITRERRAAIEKALSTLKPMEAIAIRGVELQGLNYEEVARKHGVSRQAVHQAYSRGMKKLTALLLPERAELS